YFPARYKLALCLKESGNSAAARQELEKLQKDHPKSPVRARVEALLKELS
ncbi:MAG TPA: tetratricopeptide repeat protein, partial [Caldithrix abyssi]|nr:tetratricopeptide repeat protein [Caldithrix abyssi]